MKSFKAPKIALGPLNAEAAAALVTAAADVALVLDESGIIRDVAFSNEELAAEIGRADGWLGKPWIDTVARDSRPKVQALLAAAPDAPPPHWRHLNQLGAGGDSIPVLFATHPLGKGGRRVAFGRDLRQMSQLQQRLVEVQQAIERGYSQLRQAETRYRLLFQFSEDAVLVVDGANGKVLEANPAAQRLFGNAARKLVGRGIADAFAPDSRPPLQLMLNALRGTGKAEDCLLQTADQAAELRVAGSSFRHDQGLVFLLRLGRTGPDNHAMALDEDSQALLRLAQSMPDGLVVTEADGTIITANAAFLDMAQCGPEETLRGTPLEGLLGRQGVEAEVLLSNLRSRGAVRLYATTLRGRLGARLEVEVSATTVMRDGKPRFGLSIRDTGARLRTAAPTIGVGGRSGEELKELIGRVSLKELVREAADAIERLCIEAALEISGDNRASAAEMLGLSRQSLYVKLRRYGLGDLDGDGGDTA